MYKQSDTLQLMLISSTLCVCSQGYYRRTAEYFPTRQRHRLGCYPVPMVHSTFLLDMRKTGMKKLAFHPPHQDYSWPFDDIIVFAFSCRVSGWGLQYSMYIMMHTQSVMNERAPTHF